MKSIARIPVVGIALWACSALSDESVQYSWAFSGGNLVANGSFENESRETCDPQASPSGVEVNCQNVDHAAFSGSRALTITVPSASLPSPAAPHKTDFLRVEPGGIYTLSFQYGILFGSVSGFRPQVEMFDEARNLVAATCPAGVPVTSCADFDYYHNVPLADLGKWKPFRATFTTHSNATFIRVSLLTYKQASTFLAGMKFDDLALTPGSSPSAVIETKAYGDASGKADRMISSDANRDAVSYVIHDNQRRPVK